MVHILIGLVFAATSREMRQAQRWHFSSALWRVGWGWRGGSWEELGGESCSFLFSKHTANLNGWSINFSGIDLHQFCLHAHTRSHFIVNQSFWKHLTEGPVLTNKPSIPAACVAPLSGHKSAAAQTSAPFPSLSLLPHSVFYPRSVRTARRVLMSGCLAWRREERGRDSSPHHLR